MERANLKNLIRNQTCKNCGWLMPEAKQFCNYFVESPEKVITCDHWKKMLSNRETMLANQKIARKFIFGTGVNG